MALALHIIRVEKCEYPYGAFVFESSPDTMVPAAKALYPFRDPGFRVFTAPGNTSCPSPLQPSAAGSATGRPHQPPSAGRIGSVLGTSQVSGGQATRNARKRFVSIFEGVSIPHCTKSK